MASGSNVAKAANFLIRFRSMVYNEINSIYIPAFRQKSYELKELIKKKSSKALQSELGQKMQVAKGFYRLEMSPPRFDEMKQLKEDLTLVKEFMQKGCYKYITVKQAWLLFLVSMEIILWFFLGETVGKMHIVGYKV